MQVIEVKRRRVEKKKKTTCNALHIRICVTTTIAIVANN